MALSAPPPLGRSSSPATVLEALDALDEPAALLDARGERVLGATRALRRRLPSARAGARWTAVLAEAAPDVPGADEAAAAFENRPLEDGRRLLRPRTPTRAGRTATTA